MSRILPLSEASGVRRVDVVFVHGLRGRSYKAWRNSDGVCWPRWFSEEKEGVATWALEYEAASTRWTGGRAMALQDRALNLLAQLDGVVGQGTSIVLVGHSLGGLVIKQMLRSAEHVARFSFLKTRTLGVGFIATPHTGSSLADVADRFRRAYWTTPAIGDLKRNSAMLRDLNDWYREAAGRLAVDHVSLCESYPTNGVLVVDAGSSDLGLPGTPLIHVDANHNSIIDVRSKESLQFRELSRLVERVDTSTQMAVGLDSDTAPSEPVTRVPHPVKVQVSHPNLRLSDVTRYSDLSDWLNDRMEPGRHFGSYAYPFVGRIFPPLLGGRVSVRILTDRWYLQPEMWVTEDGRFNNRIYVDERKPPARIEISVIDADGVEVSKESTMLE